MVGGPQAFVTGGLVTVAEVAAAMRVSNMTVYRLIKSGELPALRVGKNYRLRVENGLIIEARLAAGGVAPLPWRLNRSEAALIGRPPEAQAIAAAGDLAIEDARPLAYNGFKIELLRNAVMRVLQTIGGRP